MLTRSFYRQLARLLKTGPPGPGRFYIAIGAGRDLWDANPPVPDRDAASLVDERARRPVNEDDIVYINDDGSPADTPTMRLALQTEFAAGEGEGPLRECGLLLGDGVTTVLLSYFTHPRLEKGPDQSLRRRIRLDLAPGRAAARSPVTRFLGNSKTTELHDLDNAQPGCQLDEIRVDRRHYFASIDEARALGYDFCARCFGRALSER